MMKRLAALPVAGLLAGLVSVPMSPSVSRAEVTAGSPAPAQVVTLVTGDRVAVTQSPGAKPEVRVMPAVTGSSFQVMTFGTQVYVVPQSAAGYLGAPLDPSLFNVTQLAADGYANAAKPLNLRITYASGSAPHAIPGITMTGTATASVDHVGALRFGAALAARSKAAAASPAAQGRLFDGITRIAVAGTSATDGSTVGASSAPGKLYTLTVKGFDRLGRKVTGSFAYVANVDNFGNFLADQSYYRGVLKFSVPAGDYQIASFITTAHPDGTYDISLVTDPQVSVSHDTVVVLDARKANRLSVATPDPASVVQGRLTLQRSAVEGPDLTVEFMTFDNTPLYAAPTAPVTKGQFYFYPYFRLGDAAGYTRNYIYDLEFPYIGSIPGNLAETVTRSQLATIHARYHSPYPGRAEYDGKAGVMPWQDNITFGADPLAAPLERTEYVLPEPGMLWYHDLVAEAQDSLADTQDIVRAYHPGEHTADNWLAQPMPPGVPDESTAGEPCPVCRSGDTLSLLLMPYVDNGGHFQVPDSSGTTDLSLYQDGNLVGAQPSTFAQFPMASSPASYKLVLEESRDAPWWPTTTHTSTTWTWTSQERPPDPLPPGWTCPGPGKGGKGSTTDVTAGTDGCSFEPLLFLGYDTNAGIDDVVPAGGQATVDLTVGHQAGAATTPISDVTAHVSFDDGATWTAVAATQTGDGRYRLVYDQPPLGRTSGFASLRVTAADAAGNTIDQTIIRAYPLAVLTPPASPSTPSAGPGQQRACGGWVAAPYAQCMAIVNTAAPSPVSDGTPSGYGPADIQSAYALPDGGAGQTVAIADAYDDPNAEADLAAYRATYGLPPCTTGNGCFTKVNQDGKAGPPPSPDAGWGLEISLDLEAVSAACPKCHIMLVEANSSSDADLGSSVNTAVALGANVVSNSYGTTGEFSGEQYFERYYYDHPRVPIVAASGDYGYGNGALLINSIVFPAASRYVVAVGGTSLVPDTTTSRGWAESAWSGSTSGCSAYIHKPGWQRDRLCGNRTVADVSAVADPHTGLAVYDSFGWGGWLVVGGTSASAPIIASVYALAGNESTQRYASGLYKNPSRLFDVTAGVNGDNCSSTYLCTAVPGYDGPTGLGTPNGVGGF
jgi:hypothetical protein